MSKITQGRDSRFARSPVAKLWVAAGLVLSFALPHPVDSAPVFAAPATGGSASALSWEVEGDGSYVGSDTLKRSGQRFGDISEIQAAFDAIASYQLNDKFLLRLGAEWERYSFDPDRSSPVPETLEDVNLVLGADVQVTPAVLMRVEVRPGLYGEFSHLSTGNFFIPIQVGASYFVSPELLLVAGFQVNVDNDIPVFPGAGVRWQVTPKFLVNGILPKPTVEYKLTDNVSAFVGASLLGGTYRLGDRYARDTGIRKLNHSVLEYEEIRAGGGLNWRLNRSLSLNAEAGCVPFRKFDYSRASYKVQADDVAPYVQVSFSCKF
jgi:Domain of unknown function (DUF6268)